MGNEQMNINTNIQLSKKLSKNYFDFKYVVGKGGFGKVWKVTFKKNSKVYALKEMSKVKIIDKKSQKSIITERNILAQLHHPFIVNMVFAFQDYENLYLVIDYLSGGDLRYHLCKYDVFSEKQSKFFLACIIHALDFIHANNIIHRDLKPENLVADANGYIRVTDFGVAKIFNPVNYKDTSGTPGYMAPEVLFGKNHTYSVDFYAMGIMGFEFIFGDRPYEGTSRKALREEIIKKQARIHSNEIPRGWSREGADFVNQLMQRKPEKRLGNTNGVIELKEHKWYSNFDWQALADKTMTSPFVPPNHDNYDKEYCEEESEINLSTNERYSQYIEDKHFGKLFDGYTFINEQDEKEFLKKFQEIQNLQKIHKKEIKTKLAPLSMQSLKSEEKQDKKIAFSNPGSKEDIKAFLKNFNQNFNQNIGYSTTRHNPNILSENLRHNSKHNSAHSIDSKMETYKKGTNNNFNSNNSTNNNISIKKYEKPQQQRPQSKKTTQLKLTASQSMRNLIPDGFLTQKKKKFSIEEIKGIPLTRKDSVKKVYLNKPLNVLNNLYSPRLKGNLPKLSSNSSFGNGLCLQPKQTTRKNSQISVKKQIIKVNAPINLNINNFNFLGNMSRTNLMHSQSTKNFSRHNSNGKLFYGRK